MYFYFHTQHKLLLIYIEKKKKILEKLIKALRRGVYLIISFQY